MTSLSDDVNVKVVVPCVLTLFNPREKVSLVASLATVRFSSRLGRLLRWKWNVSFLFPSLYFFFFFLFFPFFLFVLFSSFARFSFYVQAQNPVPSFIAHEYREKGRQLKRREYEIDRDRKKKNKRKREDETLKIVKLISSQSRERERVIFLTKNGPYES